MGEVGYPGDRPPQGADPVGGGHVRGLLAGAARRQGRQAGLGKNMAQLDTSGSQLVPNGSTAEALGQYPGRPAGRSGTQRVGEGGL